MKDWKYILYVGGAFFLYLVVRLSMPKQHDWTLTLAHDDKDPYGTYVLYELMPDFLKNRNINHSYKPIVELKEEIKTPATYFILADGFGADKTESSILLDHVSKGGTAFISAQYFRGAFADTLNVYTDDYFFSKGAMNRADTSYLSLANPTVDSSAYLFLRDNIHHYFGQFDTTRTTVIAQNDYQQPVTIRVAFGKGSFILNSTPIALTNIYMLSKDNHEFVASTLSYLPDHDIYWTEYYQQGRREARTPLRYILSNEPLTWAYYLTIATILIFMLFEAKRKQRVIPVMKPLANTSLEFVATVGNLYYQNGNHKNAAEKKINFFFEQIRSQYLLRTNQINDEFINALANKSNNNKEEVEALFKKIAFIQSSTAISPEQLIDLNERLERFNKQTR
jgi:hypothetical protein